MKELCGTRGVASLQTRIRPLPAGFNTRNMSNASQVEQLKQSIKVYEEVIDSFEAARARLHKRRSGATDAVMVHVDESLALNERALISLKKVLVSAKEQLRQER